MGNGPGLAAKEIAGGWRELRAGRCLGGEYSSGIVRKKKKRAVTSVTV